MTAWGSWFWDAARRTCKSAFFFCNQQPESSCRACPNSLRGCSDPIHPVILCRTPVPYQPSGTLSAWLRKLPAAWEKHHLPNYRPRFQQAALWAGVSTSSWRTLFLGVTSLGHGNFDNPTCIQAKCLYVEKSPAYSIKIKHHRSFQMVLWSIGGGIHKITMQNHAPPTKNTLPMWKSEMTRAKIMYSLTLAVSPFRFDKKNKFNHLHNLYDISHRGVKHPCNRWEIGFVNENPWVWQTYVSAKLTMIQVRLLHEHLPS